MERLDETEKAMETAALLNKDILESYAYKRYSEAKSTLNGSPALKLKYDGFMREHVKYQERLLGNENIPFAEQKSISSKYAEIMLEPCISGFIESKRILVDFLNGVMEKAFHSIEDDVL